MNRVTRTMAVIAAAALIVLALAGPASGTKPDPEHLVDICHATPPDTAANGWNQITVDVASAGYRNSGHEDQHAADIIPPYSYVDADGVAFNYPGKGEQAILENGCTLPASPEPSPTASPTPSPEPSASPTPSPEPTPTPTPSPIAPTPTPEPTPTGTPTTSPTPVPSMRPTCEDLGTCSTPTPSPLATPTPTPSPAPTPVQPSSPGSSATPALPTPPPTDTATASFASPRDVFALYLILGLVAFAALVIAIAYAGRRRRS